MSSLWITVLVASFGCYGLKLAGFALPQSVLSHPRTQRITVLLPVAMLSALIVTSLFDSQGSYGANWHTLVGVGAGAVAVIARRSLLFVFVVAVAVAGLSHLIA